MKRNFICAALAFCALCASAELRFQSLDNKRGTNISLTESDGRSDIRITDAVFHNGGKAFPVKNVKCETKDGQTRYQLKFKRLTTFKNCYLTLKADGREQTIDIQSRLLE